LGNRAVRCRGGATPHQERAPGTKACRLTPGRATRAGERSVARRLLRAAAPSLADAAAARALGAAASDADLRRALERHAGHAHLAALAQARPPRSPAAHEALARPERRASALLRPGNFTPRRLFVRLCMRKF